MFDVGCVGVKFISENCKTGDIFKLYLSCNVKQKFIKTDRT